MTQRLLSVCIASIGRPSLRDTIEGVLGCAVPSGFSLQIVIADDSGTSRASAVLGQLADTPGLRIVPSGAKNIAIARNRAMEAANGDYLIFIDDDEVPAADWLQQLVTQAETSGAEGVQGGVKGIYPEHAPAWAKALRPYDKRYGAPGDTIAVGSTCNLLLRRTALVAHGLQFNPALGRTGGEDTDLCFRLTTGGGRIVCGAAMVFERVPLERLTPHHLLRRYARGGHSYASTVLAHRSAPQRALEAFKALVSTAVFSVAAAAAWRFVPATSMRYALRLAGNVGKLLAFLGRPAWNLY